MNDHSRNFFKNPGQAPVRFPPDTLQDDRVPSTAETHLSGDVLSRMRTNMQAIHKPITEAMGQAASAPAHPEEIRAKVTLRLGKRGRLKATLRTTPAGLVCAGIMTAAIFLSIAAVARAARWRY